VTDPSWVGVIAPDGVGPSADRGRPWRAVGVGSGDPFVRSTCGDCRQCPLTADVRRRRPVGVDSGSVANRSVTCPTRLETRTKESNMCASQWVLRNLEAKWKQSPALAVGPGRILRRRWRRRTTGPSLPQRRRGGARAYTLGPERWWTMPE